MPSLVAEIESRDKQIQDAVAQVVNTWTKAAVIALYRQIKICEPHWPTMLAELELMYLKELKQPALKPFQE